MTLARLARALTVGAATAAFFMAGSPAGAQAPDDDEIALPANWATLDVDDDGVVTDSDCSQLNETELAGFAEWASATVETHDDDDVRRWRSQFMNGATGEGPCKAVLTRIPADGVVASVTGAAGDIVSAPVDAVTGVVAKGFEAVADSFAEGAATLLQETSALWTRVPSSSTTATGVIDEVQDDLRVITIVVGTVGLIIGLTRVALKRRAEELYGSGMGLLWMMMIGSAGTFVLVMLLEAGDEFSSWLLDRAGSNGMSTGADVVLTGGQISSSGLLFVLALLAIVTSLIQIALLFVRGAAVVVLAGAAQLAAAASVAGGGASLMLRRTLAWLAAFVLYKPAAAICYAAAFRLMESSEGNTAEQAMAAIQGLVLLVLAILALPAMIRLTVPMASMAGPSTAGALAAGAAVATGAVMLAGGMGAGASGVIGSGSGGSGMGGFAGPSGAAGPSGGGSGSGGGSAPPSGGGSGSGGGSAPPSGGSAGGAGVSGMGAASWGSGGSSGGSSGAAAAGRAGPSGAAGRDGASSNGSSEGGADSAGAGSSTSSADGSSGPSGSGAAGSGAWAGSMAGSAASTVDRAADGLGDAGDEP